MWQVFRGDLYGTRIRPPFLPVCPLVSVAQWQSFRGYPTGAHKRNIMRLEIGTLIILTKVLPRIA